MTIPPDQAKVQATDGARYTELDSLRGVAALTVLFFHFRMMWFGYGHGPKWWLTLFSPIAAGHEAVMLFFLLSGFVLSVPHLRGKTKPYPVYLARRVLRIYGPYFFALLLAIAGAALWHGPLPGGEWPNLTWSQPVHAKLVLAHVLMIGNYDNVEYNTAFWSLVTEMRVSIVFPLLYFAVIRMRASAALGLALVGTLATAVVIQHTNLVQTLISVQYAMVFLCGIVLAKHVERVSVWYHGLPRWPRVLFAGGSFLLYTWGFRLSRFAPHRAGLDQVLITLGAAGYLILALNAAWTRRALRSTGARFLGRISYSLYLVHGTVLFGLAHLLGNRVSLLTQFLLFIGLSIALSFLFCLGIEEQFLRLSRMVGRTAIPQRDGLPADAAELPATI